MPITPNRAVTHVQGVLFPIHEESNFCEAITMGLELYHSKPSIGAAIARDQDRLGLEKKRLRTLDAKWLDAQANTSGIKLIEEEENQAEQMMGKLLHTTKPRMDPEVVFIFVLVRSYLGSIKGEHAATFIKESMFLRNLLREYGLHKVPSASTILDQLNALSDETSTMLLQATIEMASQEVDIKKVYIDSTRISADSTWPTESVTILQLLLRVNHGFEMLRDDQICVNLPSDRWELLSEITSAAKSIALDMGKKGSKCRRNRYYKVIFKAAKKLIKYFGAGYSRIGDKLQLLKPSVRERALAIAEMIEVDLHNADLCVQNAKSRVVKDKKVPAESKVLGCADPDAEIIAKGEKPLVFGYKPQIARSEQGFILSVLVPRGAASDQSMAVPITKDVIENLQKVPEAASFDDGYTDKDVLEKLTLLGIEKVSFSGSRAKRLLPEEDYESEFFQQLRNERSMAESTMSVLKCFFDLGRFRRRGLSAVTQELQGVATYHNLSLLAKIRRKDAKKKAG